MSGPAQKTVTTLDVITGPDTTGPVGAIRLSRSGSGLQASVDGGAPAALGGGTVTSVVAGTGITVDATDPAAPIVSLTSNDSSTIAVQGTTITVSGLAGDTDGDYEINLTLDVVSPGLISLQPNADASNGISREVNVGTAGTPAGAASNSLTIVNGPSTGIVSARLFMSSKSGRLRLFTSDAYDGTDAIGLWRIGHYTSTATVITSLVVKAANANGFNAGSTMRVRRLRNPG